MYDFCLLKLLKYIFSFKLYNEGIKLFDKFKYLAITITNNFKDTQDQICSLEKIQKFQQGSKDNFFEILLYIYLLKKLVNDVIILAIFSLVIGSAITTVLDFYLIYIDFVQQVKEIQRY